MSVNNEFLNKLEELKELALSAGTSPSIGIGITTHNRYQIFKKTLEEIKRFAPANSKIVVVDDASSTPVPEASYRFEQNAGIARSKNKCFELLYNAGCEHFFLFDDDCYPITENWYEPYINSDQPHLNYIFREFKGTRKPVLNDTIVLYQDSKIKAYSHTRGCMCYYRRICLDVCGGMSPLFGKWGFEHPDLSNRIYNNNLTLFRYMDVPDSDKLLYSRDEHTGNADSTVQGQERSACIIANSKIYDTRKESTEYVAFREKEDIIITCLFTKVTDTQRSSDTSIKADKTILKPLIDSLNGQKLIILNDCFDNTLDNNVAYIHVETFSNNVYFQRWVSYYQYLLKNRDRINRLFIVDGTDVQMLHNPFKSMEPGKLYLGDEAEKTGCEWLIKYHPHRLIQEFIKANENKVLLNAGITGGEVDIILSFIQKLLSFYYQSVSDHYFSNKPECGLTDMGLFNYIARTHFSNKLVHGTQVNTVFKAEKANAVSWFKHK